MRTRTGTGLLSALFLGFSLLCSGSLLAQDKLLTNYSGVNNNVADPTAVNCWQYGSDGTTCIAGQYYRSDNTTPVNDPTKFAKTATSNTYGAWTTSPNNGSSSGCISCHHSGVSTSGVGGAYLIGGHKSILRKVVPGKSLLNSNGDVVTTVADHNGVEWTMDWTSGTVGGNRAYYLAGWSPEPDVFGINLPNYGSCGRCHTTGYRFDANGPEPTSYDGTTYTKLTDLQFPRTPHGGAAGTTSSWYLSGIQCERCHKGDMQYDATSINASYNSGTPTAPVVTATAGRISHLTSIYVDPSNVDTSSCAVNGTRVSCNVITPIQIGDFVIKTVAPVGGSSSNLTGNGTFTGRPLPKAPYALLCVECHQAYSTWTSKTAGQNGEVHLTPLPGFEDLATPIDTTKFTSTKLATGQFSATWGCTGASGTVATNDYDGCINAGGTVTYVPGGMSHGAVTTILNSPHGRVTGYVDTKNPATPDSTLTIKGGTLKDGTVVNGQFNTFFASENGVAGSCMGCHNVHGYLNGYFETTATNVETTLTNCTKCHASHGKVMNHPTGAGTPYPDGNFGSQESCNICHFSKKTGTEYHFLRINTDPSYHTFPDAKTYYTTYGSGKFGKLNTYPEPYTDTKTYQQKTYPAVGLDVDIACGQCHTGGDGSKNPYGLTAYAGDGGVAPRPYSRAFLAAKAAGIHATGASAPTFSTALPATGGPTTITITTTDQSEGSYASIFYTTDGTTPTATVNASEQYVAGGTTQVATGGSVSIPVNSTTTIYAFAAGPASYSFSASPIVGGTYGVQTAPTPVIAPTGAALTYPATVSVKITEAASVPVYYTTDGTIPTASSTQYTAPIVVKNSMTIKARAIDGSNYAPSAIASATFTVKPPTPTWSNVAPAKFPGTYTGAVTALLNNADPNATICYTTNGTTPALVNGVCNGTSVAPGTSIPVSASQTIKAIAVDGTVVSSMTSGTYVIK